MLCCFESCQAHWYYIRTLSWIVKLFFAAFAVNMVCLVTWLCCTKLRFLLIWKLSGCMWKRIHRITNVCRFCLLDVLPPVTIYKLQRIALLLNLINRHIHAKRVLVSFADTCTLEIEQLGTISSCSLPMTYSAFRWGDRIYFSFLACFTEKFLVLLWHRNKIKRGREFFSRSLCAMVNPAFRRIHLFLVKITKDIHSW